MGFVARFLEHRNVYQYRWPRVHPSRLAPTDIDKRFYTHEIRELERYRTLGVSDGINDNSVWNDAHTATLEDYKVNEKTHPLYTPEAEDAYIKAELKNYLGDK